MENQQQQKVTQPKSVLSLFFSLGDKVTGGNPQRKMDFDYYMMWIIFLAFGVVFIGNIYHFIVTKNFANIGWAMFGMAIMWFQYFNLKNMYLMREYQRQNLNRQDVVETIDSPNEMLKKFKKLK